MSLSRYTITYIMAVAMTMLPVIGLFIAIFYFKKKFILNEQKMNEITDELKRGTAQ